MQKIAELAQALTKTRQELGRLHGVQAAAAAAIAVGGGSLGHADHQQDWDLQRRRWRVEAVVFCLRVHGWAH